MEFIKQNTTLYPDFPKPGILFRDLSPLYKDPKIFQQLLKYLAEAANKLGKFDYIAGIEARGFILGSALAAQMNCGFIPVRKKGKLPGKCLEITYSLEYGQDTLQIQEDEKLKNSSILIIDDVFATGGTLKAVASLVKTFTNKVCGLVICDIGITDLSAIGIPAASLFYDR